MRPAKMIAITMLGLVLLWSAPARSATPLGDSDGWYKWEVAGDFACGSCSGVTTFYVRKEDGKPTRIRASGYNCRMSVPESATDLGSLSQDESVAIFLDIVKNRNFDIDVREDALLWLAQSDSDIAFEYFDQLLFDT